MQKNRTHLLTLTLVTTFISSLSVAEEQNTTKSTTPHSLFNESAQAQASGFLEGSDLNVLVRNLYFNRDYRNSSHNGYGSYKAQSYREEWGQAFIGTYQSGFTEGTIGFGVDAFGMYGFKLNSGKGRTHTGMFPINDKGKAEDNFAKYGGAIKVRLSNTTLKYGQQMVDTPIFSTDDARLFPETATGFLLTSNEIKDLTLNVGHFTTMDAMDQTYRDSRPNDWDLYKRGSHKQGSGLKRADFVGGTYQFTPMLSASVYYSDVTDFWKKKYVGLDYTLPISEEQALNFNVNYYNTKSQGPVKQLSREVYNGHKIDSNAWSMQVAYTYEAHKFTLAHQRVTGHGMGNPYGVDGGAAIYLNNSIQYSDFNNEGERSWQARYDLDMGKYGVPGLSFMTRYVRGTNISAYLRDSNKSGGKVTETEHDMEAKYVVQTGAAKDLSFRLRYAMYRSSGFSNDLNELRFITEYPWDILGMFKK